MLVTKIRRIIGLVLCLGSIAILVYTTWPNSFQSREVSFSHYELNKVAAELEPGGAARLVFPEELQVQLDWPTWLRENEIGQVHLFVDTGMDATLLNGDLNIYDRYTMSLETRLEFPGVQVAPPGNVSQPLPEEGAIQFDWNIRPNERESPSGTLWLHLDFIPRSGGSIQHRLLMAQQVNLRTVNLLGINMVTAQVLGIVGVVIGVVLWIDVLVDWVMRRK